MGLIKFRTLDSEVKGTYRPSKGAEMNDYLYKTLRNNRSCGFCYYYTAEK